MRFRDQTVIPWDETCYCESLSQTVRVRKSEVIFVLLMKYKIRTIKVELNHTELKL